jgi:tetratricopeptide (TPR) repeat protein
LTHIGRLLGKKRDYAHAEMALNAALEIIPNYHYALGNLAEIRKEQKNFSAAADLYRKRSEVAPHPENLYDLGDALTKAGRKAEAHAVFARFEPLAIAESEKFDNSNRELALYYLDYANKPAQGLRIAQFEANRRRDVHTLEVYAKALRINRKPKEAQSVLAESEERLNATRKAPVVRASN